MFDPYRKEIDEIQIAPGSPNEATRDNAREVSKKRKIILKKIEHIKYNGPVDEEKLDTERSEAI